MRMVHSTNHNWVLHTFLLILRYKFKIPKSKNINIRTSQSKYLMYILTILGVLTLLVAMFIKNAKYLLICIVIYRVIDCGYKIKHLKNNKSRYYVIIELIFLLY